MDNKDTFPQEEDFSPETHPEAEVTDPAPAVEEIPMSTGAIGDITDLPEAETLPEEAQPEVPAVPEASPAEMADADSESNEIDPGTAFMERIPDVDEDPISEAMPSLTGDAPLPEAPQDSILDEFDLSILNDPEFAAPAEEPAAEEVDDREYRDNGKEFDEMLNAPEQKKVFPPYQRPAGKGRPKRKKGEGLLGIPNILATGVWLALILVIGVTLGRMLWVCAADVLAFGREDKLVTVTIYESDTMEDIIDKLHNSGLIRYKSLFSLYADISDAQEDIVPGIYDLNTRYDYHALVNFMSPRSSREVVELTIPEGYSCKQIFALLEENRVCTAVDIAAYAADGELDEYWFLEEVQRGSEYCLEGFLFPDTYEFYKNSSPREALQKMLDNFDYRFSEKLREKIDTLNEKVTGGGYGIREVVIVASLIEKESAKAEESPMIAGVIYNRLFNWDYPALLNIDAAIVYAQGGDAEHIDTSLDSPYNTYLHTGLTPTPIANPGLSSLKAALSPESHDYYYYVLNPATGMHQFSKTQEEHNNYIEQFYG